MNRSTVKHPRKPWHKNLTEAERQELYDAGYILDHYWVVGPGIVWWEYALRRRYEKEALHVSKSARACFNFYKKHGRS